MSEVSFLRSSHFMTIISVLRSNLLAILSSSFFSISARERFVVHIVGSFLSILWSRIKVIFLIYASDQSETQRSSKNRRLHLIIHSIGKNSIHDSQSFGPLSQRLLLSTCFLKSQSEILYLKLHSNASNNFWAWYVFQTHFGPYIKRFLV